MFGAPHTVSWLTVSPRSLCYCMWCVSWVMRYVNERVTWRLRQATSCTKEDEDEGHVWEDFTTVHCQTPESLDPQALSREGREGESNVLMKPRIHESRGGVCGSSDSCLEEEEGVEFVFNATWRVFLTLCWTMSLGDREVCTGR